MSDSRINLLGGEFAARALRATAQSRTNIYLDVSAAGDKSKVVGYLMPGQSPWYQTVYSPFSSGSSTYLHGLHWWPDYNTIVIAERFGDDVQGLRYVSSDGSSGWADGFYARAFAEHAQAVFASYGNQLLVAGHSTGPGAVMVAGATFPSMTHVPVATDITTPPDWCAYLGGRFIIPWRDYAGRFTWSAINDASTWSAGDYATAESSSDPLVRGIVWRGILVLFATRTTEFWQVTGDSIAPYQAISGATGDYGCISGKSVQLVEGTVVFAALMPQGNRAICKLVGYEAVPISTPDIDYLLARHNNVLYSASYRVSGHAFYEVTFDDPADPITYCYDMQSGIWLLRKTNGMSCSQITSAIPFVDDNGNNIVLCGSSRGAVNLLSASIYTEADNDGVDTAIPWEVILPHVYDVDGFNLLRAPMLRLDMQGGDVDGQKPVVTLNISRDGGQTYGGNLDRHFSDDSEPNFRPEWRRLGIARSLTFKLSGQNNCRTALINAFLLDMDKADK